MWTVFLVSFFITLLVIYLPGSLILSACFGDKAKAIALAPAVSCGVYSILGIVFGKTGFLVDGIWFILLSLIIALIVYLILAKASGVSLRGEDSERGDSFFALLCVGASLTVLVLYFVKNLNGPDSVMQQSDNAWHLAVISEMLKSGNYSILDVGIRDGANGGFYPAAWHMICAFSSSISGCSAAVSENAVNLAFSGVVLPVASFYMLRSLLPGERGVRYSAPICVIASTAFPIGLFLFGPLYPNLAGMCSLPAFIALFVVLLDHSEKGARWRMGVLFPLFLSLVGIASLHPNTVFLAAIILVPYGCHALYGWAMEKTASRRKSLLAAGFLALLCAALWTVAFYLPAFQGTVGYQWPSITAGDQAFLDVATLALRNGVPQIGLALLVFVGAVACFARRKNRWITLPFLFACTQYYFCASTDGFLDSFLTGFWYTDQWRIAANVAFTAIPLSCMGLSYIGAAISRGAWLVASDGLSVDGGHYRKTMYVAVLAVAAFFLYSPSFSSPSESQETAFGYAGGRIEELNSGYSATYSSYTNDEKSFVDEVEKIVGDDLVFNCPPDGSCFAYLEDGLNVFYRTYSDHGPGSLSQEADIRSGLSSYAFDENVKNDVSELGIKYILKLDMGDSFVDYGDYQWSINTSYKKSSWNGVLSIDDNTPGFDLVLSEGDMRLYKIAS